MEVRRAGKTDTPAGGGISSNDEVAEIVLVSSREGKAKSVPAEDSAQSSTAANTWELVRANASAGTNVLPVPFPHPELGYILEGRVRFTELPPDYDPDTVAREARVEELGSRDAFSFDAGDRIMIEVLADLTFLLVRPVRKESDRPPACCA